MTLRRLPLCLILLLCFSATPALSEGGTWPPIGQLVGGGSAYSVAVQGDYAYVDDVEVGADMAVIDISSPSHPQLVGYYDGPGRRGSAGVAVAGGHAYVPTGRSGLRVLDVSDPAAPVEVGYYDTHSIRGPVVVAGNYVYCNSGDGLRVIDVSDPAAPVAVGYWGTCGGALGVAVAGDYAYVADGGSSDVDCDPGLRVISVADPVSPVEVGSYDTPDRALGVAVAGGYAYVAAEAAGLRVISVADPVSPVEVGYCDTPGKAFEVAVAGGYAYVADLSAGLRVISVADPANPHEVGFYDTPSSAHGVAVAGDYAYVADLDAGLRVIDVSDPSAPVEVGCWDAPTEVAGLAAADDYVCLGDGEAGLRVVEVSDPSAPVEVGNSSRHAGAVAVAGGHAYAVGAGGLQVISIADPANPVEVGFCDAPYYDPSRPTGVAVAGHYAYVVGTGITSWPYTPVGRLWVISVSDPANPVEVGFYERTDSYFNGVAVAGDYAYVAALGLCVISVADPANPVEVRYWGMPGRAEGVAVAGDYAYLADPFAGLRVISVADPANPVQVGHFDIPDDGEARGVAVAAGYAYVAADEVGLRMIDVSNPRAPVEVRYWDTPGSARTVTAGGGYAYLGDRSWGMLVFRAPSFDDVRLAHWAFWETEACVAAGIVAGYDDGLFHPDWSVSRDQMAVFISRSICTPTGEAGMADYVPPDTPTFADVPTDHWAYKYVEYCVASEIVGGYPYPDPDNPGQDIYLYLPILGVTRDQMAVFISRAVAGDDDSVPDGPDTATFDDVPTDHWAFKYVEYCAAEGIVQGYDPDTYGPTGTVSRDQMAVVICRAFDLTT